MRNSLPGRSIRLDEKLYKVEEKLAAFFSGLDDPDQMKVLIMKYVDLKTVEEIRKELDRSERFVQLKHRFGIKEAKKLYSAEKAS